MKRTCPILLLLSFFFILPVHADDQKIDLREGDILFQDSPSPPSDAIKLATGSKYSHCGIVFFEDSVPKIWEAKHPVCVTPLHQWIVRDTGNHFVVMRLKGADTLLNGDIISRMKTYADLHQGKNYDPYFEWSDSALYCSEYVWKIFKQAADIELAPLRKMGEYDLSHPLVRKQLEMRYDSIPVDEPVIAPGDLFNSPLLDTVLVR